MTGPRDYGVGTERALFHLARGRCYYPSCLVPILRMLDGQPVVNVEISHIHGALPGSARYDRNMTDRQRASFENLLLLCTAHHKLVDRLAPDKHSPRLLHQWKADAEADGGLDALRELDGLLEEGRLAELIEQAVTRVGPTREVTVTLDGGMLHEGHQAVTYPLAGMRELLRLNETMRRAEQLVVVTVRNIGFVDVTIESIVLHYNFTLQGRADDPEASIALLGGNDFGRLNPDLPKRLLSGDALHWLTRLSTLAMIARRSRDASFTSLHTSVHLGSGEAIESECVTWDVLPLDLVDGDV